MKTKFGIILIAFFSITKLQLFAQINKTNNLEIENISHFDSLLSIVDSNKNSKRLAEIACKSKNQNHAFKSPISTSKIHSFNPDSSTLTSRKGTVKVTFFVSPMLANTMLLKTTNSKSETLLGWGWAEIGVDYFIKPKQYLSLNFLAAQAINVKGPISRNKGYVNSVNFLHCHTINKLEFGYGISLSYNTWESDVYNPAGPRLFFSTTGYSWGLSFNGQYRFSRVLNLRFIYQPSFFEIGANPSYYYQHTMGLGIGFKLLIRGK